MLVGTPSYSIKYVERLCSHPSPNPSTNPTPTPTPNPTRGTWSGSTAASALLAAARWRGATSRWWRMTRGCSSPTVCTRTANPNRHPQPNTLTLTLALALALALAVTLARYGREELGDAARAARVQQVRVRVRGTAGGEG